MPKDVQINLATILSGPKGVSAVAKQIQNQLRGVTAQIDIKINRNASQSVEALSTRIDRLAKSAAVATKSVTTLNSAVEQLQQTFNSINVASSQTAKNLQNFNGIASQVARHSKGVEVFANRFELLGDRVGLAFKRLGAFSLAFRPIIAFTNALDTAVTEAVEFQDQMVRLSQIVGGNTIRDVSSLSKQIRTLSTTFGVSSKELAGIGDTLLQAGLKANETRLALQALAKVPLAPTFESMEQAGEGLIAMMGQFGVTADQFSKRLSQINTLSAKYAVESSDLINAVRKSGASFAGAGGNLEELLALFTAVRASSRESADTIATSFRTIFARLQRPGTVNFLESLGVQLRDIKGNFVGPFQAILNIAEKLNKINPQSQLFAQVVEEIGGIRQVNKVQTLLKETAAAREALNVAQNAGNSLDEDAAKRQASLAVQLTKLSESFKNIFKTLATDKTFLSFTESILSAATAVTKLVDQLAPLAPLIVGLGSISIAGKIGSFTQGFGKRLTQRAAGGMVGGTGNKDSELSMLMPGEFVVNKRAVNAIGAENLHRLNEGRIGKYAKGTPRRKTYSNFNDLSKDMVDELAMKAGLNKRQRQTMLGRVGYRASTPPRPFEVGGSSYATGAQAAGGYGDSRVKFDQIAVLKDQNRVAMEATIQEEDVIQQQKIRKKNLKKANRVEEQAILAQQNAVRNASSMKSLVNREPVQPVHHPLPWVSTSRALVPSTTINVPTGGFRLPPKPPVNFNLPVLNTGDVINDRFKASQAAKNKQYSSMYYGGDDISAIRPRTSASLADPMKTTFVTLTQAVKQNTKVVASTFNDSGLHKIRSSIGGNIPGLEDLRTGRRSKTVDPLRANRLAAMGGGGTMLGSPAISSHYHGGYKASQTPYDYLSAGQTSSPVPWTVMGMRNQPWNQQQLGQMYGSALGLNDTTGMSAMQKRGLTSRRSVGSLSFREVGTFGFPTATRYFEDNPHDVYGPGMKPSRQSRMRGIGNGIRGVGRLAGRGINKLRDPRAAAALGLSTLAANPDTPGGAAFQSAAGVASSALLLGANPFTALAGGAVVGASAYQDAKQNKDLELFMRQLQARGVQSGNLVTGNRNLVNQLTDSSQLNLLEGGIAGGVGAWRNIKARFTGGNAALAEQSAYDDRTAQKRGQQLQKLQPELATQSAKLQAEIEEMLKSGMTRKQIGKKINLKEASFLFGAANSSNPEASMSELQKDGDRLSEDFFKMHEPASRVAQALQKMEIAINLDVLRFQELGDKVHEAAENANRITDMNSIFSGEYAPANIGGAGTNLALASFGNLNNKNAQAATNAMLGSFGGVGTKLASDLTDIAVSEKLLTKIFAEESATASNTEDIGSFTGRVADRLGKEFKAATGRNLGIRASEAVSLNLGQGMSDNATVADIKSKIQDPDFAGSIFRDQKQPLEEVRKQLGEDIKDFAEKIHATFSAANANLEKIADLTNRRNVVGTSAELLKRSFAQNDLVDVNLLQKDFLAKQSGFLTGAGVGNIKPTDITKILAARSTAQGRLVNARNGVANAATPAQQADAAKEFNEAEKAMKNLDKAVNNLADNMDDLNQGPLARLNQISSEKNARLGIGERLLGGGGVDAMRFLQRGLAMKQVMQQGNFNNLPQNVRQMALEGFNERAGLRIGGRLVEEIKNDLIKKSIPGLVPADLANEEKKLQQQVLNNLALQGQAIQGNINSLDINTGALNNNAAALDAMMRAIQARGIPAIPGNAMGGIPAKGTDNTLALLTPGEFVINRKSTEKFLPLLHKINAGALNPDDVQYAARGKRMRQRDRFGDWGPRVIDLMRGERRARRGLVDRQTRMERRRGLDENDFGRNNDRGWGQRAPLREHQRRFRQFMFRDDRATTSVYSRAASKRNARQRRLALRGYAKGGQVAAGGGGGANIDTSWVAQYVSITNAHIQALNNFPREIQMTGTHQVNVVVNGGDVLQSIQPLMQQMIDDGIRKATKGSYRGMTGDDRDIFSRLDAGLS